MYYGNQNPFGRDSYRTMMIKDARGDFSRFHLGIIIYIASAYVVSFIADIILFIILKDNYASFIGNIYFQWIMGVLPMYIIGLPLLYVTVRTMPTQKLEKSKLSLKEFFAIFAIGQALMTIGNVVGVTINDFFASLKGEEITNSTSELIENSPMWLTVLVAVIIGPVIEEFIFRKLMLDRLSKYGYGTAIFVSGISFGLFHGNLYQFFYAALLGMLLAFVTIKTGNWLYSVFFHILMNFFGSVVALPFINMSEEITVGIEAIQNGGEANAKAIVNSSMLLISYSVIQYAIIIAGIFFLVYAIRNKRYVLKDCAQVNIPKEDVASAVLLNVGTIVYIIISLILFALSVLIG